MKEETHIWNEVGDESSNPARYVTFYIAVSFLKKHDSICSFLQWVNKRTDRAHIYIYIYIYNYDLVQFFIQLGLNCRKVLDKETWIIRIFNSAKTWPCVLPSSCRMTWVNIYPNVYIYIVDLPLSMKPNQYIYVCVCVCVCMCVRACVCVNERERERERERESVSVCANNGIWSSLSGVMT